MDCDVVIVGAGFAGSCIACSLSKQGISTILLDRQAVYPEAFRAEKIEADQAAILRRNDLLDARSPPCAPLGHTITYKHGKRSLHDTVEQYGIAYSDTVNSIRGKLQAPVELRIATVAAVENSPGRQRVQLQQGGTLECRLVIIATGRAGLLLQSLGFVEYKQPSLRSLSFGFYLEPVGRDAFDFSGFDYFLEDDSSGIDFLTLMRIGSRMRANLFTQWTNRDDNVRRFRTEPVAELRRHFPDLQAQIGDFELGSPVQAFATEFYRVGSTAQPGVVLAGDTFQSVSPTTGTGLSKVLTDADLLGNMYVPKWLSLPAVGADVTREFYADPRKRRCDRDSLSRWIHYRDRKRGFWGQQASRIELRWNSLLGRW